MLLVHYSHITNMSCKFYVKSLFKEFLEICNKLINLLLFCILFLGESALHLAIVYGDFEMVRLLVEDGANVNQRATGRFFLPEDQKKGIKQTTSYEGKYKKAQTH